MILKIALICVTFVYLVKKVLIVSYCFLHRIISKMKKVKN